MFQLSRGLFQRFNLIFGITVLAASLAACSGMNSHPSNTQFAAGWSEHARPLFFHGIGRDAGHTIWQVPNILPRGKYRVIVRKSGPEGETAELVDGQRFEVDDPMKEIYLNISNDYHSPEALDEKYISGLDGAAAK